MKKGVLRNVTKFTGKHLCQSLFFKPATLLNGPQVCNFIKKEALAQVFFCEFCETFKNTFFTEHLLATASDEDSLMCSCTSKNNEQTPNNKETNNKILPEVI